MKFLRQSVFRHFSVYFSVNPYRVTDQLSEISKETETTNLRNPKKKFREQLNIEMIKLHEHLPIDRQVQGFRTYK